MLLQLGGIAQADSGLLPGQQVAGADGEDVRAVLVRQEGAVPGGQRLVVGEGFEGGHAVSLQRMATLPSPMMVAPEVPGTLR